MSDWQAPGHDEWVESVGAYALGALPDDEASAFEAHLEACVACRLELDELGPAVAALPASVPPLVAPAAVRERVMADVRREAELLRAAGPEADRPAPARPRRRFGWAPRWAIPAFAAAALAIGFVVGEVASNSGGGSRTVQLAAAPAVRGAHARLTLGNGSAMLAADHLPAATRGRVYMVWLKPHGGAPQPTASLFVPRSDGTAMVAVPARAAQMESVIVNMEPPGGSARPTTPPVLTAKLTS